MIEGEHSLFGERGHELIGEEGIAAGLLVHQLSERCGALRSQRSVSAISSPRCSRLSGASLICVTFPPAVVIASSLRSSGWAAATSLSR